MTNSEQNSHSPYTSSSVGSSSSLCARLRPNVSNSAASPPSSARSAVRGTPNRSLSKRSHPRTRWSFAGPDQLDFGLDVEADDPALRGGPVAPEDLHEQPGSCLSARHVDAEAGVPAMDSRLYDRDVR